MRIEGGTTLDSRDESSLERWVDLSRDILQSCWSGDIEYTQDAVARLMKT